MYLGLNQLMNYDEIVFHLFLKKLSHTVCVMYTIELSLFFHHFLCKAIE